MASNFNYTSLHPTEIRLLVLDPGQDKDVLRGSIVDVQHDPEQGNVPQYEAISYAWGDQTNPDSINLRVLRNKEPSVIDSNDGNAIDAESSLSIGQNLSAVLRHLRHEADTRTLWCDSICINQQDFDERAAQVRRMGEIFKHAQRVIAWLGLADEYSHLAIQTLKQCADYIDFSNEEEAMLANKINLKPEAAALVTDMETNLPLSPQQWTSLEALLSRSWFRRLWVRQEILLANKDTIAMVGKDSIPFLHFSGAIDLISIKRMTLEAIRPLHLSVHFFNVRTFSFLRHLRDLSSLIAFTHNCEVTDQRDRIYGLLGLAEGPFVSGISIDYKKGVKEVFRDALIDATAWHSDLKLLSFCDSASEPTWVPDFHRIQDLRPITHTRAALASDVEGKVLDFGHVWLQGIRCDTIVEHLGPHEQGPLNEQLRAAIVRGAVRFLGPDPEFWTQEEVKKFCLAILVHDFHLYPPQIDGIKGYLASLVRSEDSVPEVHFLQFIHYLTGRSLYWTRMGYVILGPRGCRTGDVVCVFLGSPLPTVLRSMENGEYQVKGPASHPALLEGEALLGPLREGWRLRYTTRALDPVFECPVHGEHHRIDPRLNDIPLPEGKELRWRDNGTPFWYTAEIDRWSNFDPRVSMEELRKRGVKVEKFTLS
ncbi:unnamed protein product [Clonostachys byssicola]|uniref:Heterokaryon incompatibility domain-containing protein n=1 Tax=Clonostachys byssicola TaxID=160290 RepID=A0A9N9U1D7_9HYPO|nr:unnamed protein product [Clonostachys byssicola]